MIYVYEKYIKNSFLGWITSLADMSNLQLHIICLYILHNLNVFPHNM